MKQSDDLNRKPGRPRSDDTHQAILQATKLLMLELGLNGVSIEGVAARAGVGKATIYRRWKSKEDLIAEVLSSIGNTVEVPDTGSTIADLISFTNRLVKSVSNIYGVALPPVVKILVGILDNPQLKDVYRKHYITPQRQGFITILERGKKRGEIREDVDIDFAIDIIVGTYFYSIMLNPGNVSTEKWTQKVISYLMDGVAP